MTKKSDKNILLAVRNRIANPTCWAKGAQARGKSGRKVVCTGVSAVSWSLYGALIREDIKGGYGSSCSPVWDMLATLSGSVLGPWRGLESFNDDAKTTHTDVLSLLDRALVKINDGS